MSTGLDVLDSQEVEEAKEAQPDSWWLSLFLPRQISSEFIRREILTFDEHQPLLLGETLIATDSAVIAWCPWDDKCPWYIEPLKRDTPRAAAIRKLAGLTMQAIKTVQASSWMPGTLLSRDIENDGAMLNGKRYDWERLEMILSLPKCGYAPGRTIVGEQPEPGLFFRWGHHGGGFLLPRS